MYLFFMEVEILERKAVKQNFEFKGQFGGFIKGIVMAYAVTAIIFIAYAIILTYSNLSEEQIPVVSVITSALCSAIAGFDAARAAKSRGILWGLLAGVVYFVILYLIGFMSGVQNGFNIAKVKTLVVCLAGGAIGGILGINTGTKRG